MEFGMIFSGEGLRSLGCIDGYVRETRGAGGMVGVEEVNRSQGHSVGNHVGTGAKS